MKTATAPKKSTAKNSRSASNGKAKVQRNKTVTRTEKNMPDEEKEQTPFEKLFEDMLKDIYWAEQQLVEALSKMHDAATTDELQSAFEDHKYVTQKHVSRLEKVFSILGKEAEAKKCDAMVGLIKESEGVIKSTEDGTMTRDAGLIICAQKVEHYEIAAYGSLVQVALTLGHDQVAQILEKTLCEEEDADALLTEIAETEVNPMADQEGEENTEEITEDIAEPVEA